MTQAFSDFPGQAPVEDRSGSLHALLLRLAGRLPDELITQARGWLAEGRAADVGQAAAFAVIAGRVPLAPVDAELLADILVDTGQDAGGLADLGRASIDPYPGYGFAPVSTDVLAAHADQVPYSMDLTASYAGPGGPDGVDEAVVSAVAAMGGEASGLWRAWRFPARDTRWPPPRRVYLAQATTAEGARLAALTARLQQALAAVGETNPQVETFHRPGGLPAYQRMALGYSALLWACAPAVPVRVAQVFDRFSDENGPGFAEGHPTLPDDERDRVLRYLESGVPLLISPSHTVDVVEPARGPVVPMAFRTDGQWIWTDAAAYYLAVYSLAPDPELCAHLQSVGFRAPEVDAVGLHRALARLYPLPTAEVGSGLEAQPRIDAR